MKSKNTDIYYLLLKLRVLEEHLGQARWSFYLALVATAASSIFSLVSVSLLLGGNVSEGVVASATGLATNVISVGCLKLAKEMNDRLDEMAVALKDDYLR